MERWMNAAYDGEDEEIYIEERVPELMNDECNPNDMRNMVDAISDDCLYKHQVEIENAMAQRDFLTLGRLIWNDIFEFMERRAEDMAQREIENGALHD